MKLNLLLLLATAALLWTAPVSAHHPSASMYVNDRIQTVEGKLVQFVLRNPHSFVYVDAPDEKGQTERWTIEWLAILQLNRQGVTGETLKAGDHLVITGFPARNPADHGLRLRTITRPKDHWKWSGTFE
jgi:hypothetical protein